MGRMAAAHGAVCNSLRGAAAVAGRSIAVPAVGTISTAAHDNGPSERLPQGC